MLAFLGLALIGCSPDDPSTAIRSGDYQFYTHRVDDACLDGALEALFMPEGRDTPHPFEFPLYVPDPDETPLSYAVDFREPFVGMPVTVRSVPGGLEVRGSEMPAVLLDEARYGDCVATMGVDVDLWPGADLQGEARLAVSDPRGEDGRCPVFQADPCQVTLDLRAEWIGEGEPEPLED